MPAIINRGRLAPAPLGRCATRTLRLALFVGCLLAGGLLVGCDSTPRAPALRNGPVFHHRQLGMRLLVPDGWNQTSNSNVPDEALEAEICVAQFTVPSTGSATLEVLVFERRFAPDVAKYHAEASQGVREWTPEGPAAPFDVEGATGERLVLVGVGPKDERRVKETLSFVRGERVVAFVASSPESDVKAREELRRALRSLVWEK